MEKKKLVRVSAATLFSAAAIAANLTINSIPAKADGCNRILFVINGVYSCGSTGGNCCDTVIIRCGCPEDR